MTNAYLFVLLIPLMFMFYVTLLVYRRDPGHEEHRAASWVMLSIFSLFLIDYAQNTFSSDYTIAIAAYIKYPAVWLTCGFSLLFHVLITRPQSSPNWFLWKVIAFAPFLLYELLLLVYGPSLYFSGLEVGGGWKFEEISPVLSLFLTSLLLFVVLNAGMAIRAWMTATNPYEKRRQSILARANLIYIGFSVLLGAVIVIVKPLATLPSTVLILPTLIWGISVRLLMINSNFLPSASSKYEALYKLSPVGIALLDKEMRVLDCNASAAAMLGKAPNDLRESAMSELIVPEERTTFCEEYARKFPHLSWMDKELRLASADGRMRTLLMDTEAVGASGERFVMSVIRDITERKEEEVYTRFLAMYDPLTRLYNRISFREKLDEALVQSKQSGLLMAVMLIDMDRFKTINDTLGHQWGDQALIAIADRLGSCLNVDGELARLGGDEFAVLMKQASEYEDVVRVAESIVNVFAAPLTLEGREFYLSPSIGISLVPVDGDDAETLLRNADITMYHAKRNGGNQYRFFSKELRAVVSRESDMESLLRKSLEKEELVLMYQPQFDVKSGCMIGAEALIRWNSDELGFVPPSEFIPLAERSGLIVPIGSWVLETACLEAAKWSAAPGAVPYSISVNVSGSQLMQPDFVGVVKHALHISNLEPGRLILEVTESMFMDKLQVTLIMLNELARLGVRISMDDFGTGYSSLSVLKQLPVMEVKIDRSFIRDLQWDELDTSIVPAIVSMSHNLGKTVVAEGVEDERQLECLRGMGCDYAQGYYYSKPVKAAEVRAMARRFAQDAG